MLIVKIKRGRQVTIPRKIFDQLYLEIGDFIEMKIENGNIIMIPLKLVPKKEVISLIKKEQDTLLKTQKKKSAIEVIEKYSDILESIPGQVGLTAQNGEIIVLVKKITPDLKNKVPEEIEGFKVKLQSHDDFMMSIDEFWLHQKEY